MALGIAERIRELLEELRDLDSQREEFERWAPSDERRHRLAHVAELRAPLRKQLQEELQEVSGGDQVEELRFLQEVSGGDW